MIKKIAYRNFNTNTGFPLNHLGAIKSIYQYKQIAHKLSSIQRFIISALNGFLSWENENKESVNGTANGCEKGTENWCEEIVSESENESNIFLNPCFYLDFYYVCVFLVENDCNSCCGCDVYTYSID